MFEYPRGDFSLRFLLNNIVNFVYFISITKRVDIYIYRYIALDERKNGQERDLSKEYIFRI